MRISTPVRLVFRLAVVALWTNVLGCSPRQMLLIDATLDEEVSDSPGFWAQTTPLQPTERGDVVFVVAREDSIAGKRTLHGPVAEDLYSYSLLSEGLAAWSRAPRASAFARPVHSRVRR